MKALRVLLVLIFTLTLFSSSTAQAKGGERYGFMPLLTQVDTSSSLHTQAQRALNRLMPQLLAGQRSGEILEFEPELNAGILKIKYAASTSTSILGTTQVFDNIHTAVAMVPHTEPAHTQAISGFSPSFLLSLYSSCFIIDGLDSNSYVVASLRNQTGVIVSNYAGTADGSGLIYDCFNYSGAFTDVLPGYKVTYKVYDSSGVTLLGTYMVVTPTIALTTITKPTSVLNGIGPKRRPFSIIWYHDNLDATDSTLIVNKTGTISSTTQWRVDFGAVPFRGGDYFDMYVAQTANFTFLTTFDVPNVYCILGSNYCVLHGTPLRSASLSITHAGIVYTFTGRFSNCGCFNVDLLRGKGTPIFLAAGDKVSGTRLSLYTLPQLTATANYTTDMLVGKAPANRYIDTAIKYVYANTWFSVRQHTNVSGNYTSDFSSQIDLIPGDALIYNVYYIDRATGNATDRYISVGP